MKNRRKKEIHKKSQMEIMGLAIIVVLISLLLLFVVMFVVNREPSKLKESFTHSELASNFIGTLLQTSTGCRKATFSDLYQDCAKFQELSSISCDGKSACVFLNDTIKQIFDDTFEQWNIAYNFTAKTTESNYKITSINNGDCDEKYSRTYPIPLHPGTLFLKLDICS